MEYALHEQLVVRIETSLGAYRRYFENEYRRVARSASTSGGQPTVITVHIVSKLPAEAPGDRRRSLTVKGLFRFNYIVRGLHSQDVTIYFNGTAWGALYAKLVTLFLQSQVLEPVIYLKLLERGILFMHAAGLSNGDNGYLFPAYGGTGKTTLSLGLMGEGMQLMGDDLLIVEPDRKIVWPYLRPLHVFSYNIRTLRDARVPLKLKAKVKLKDWIRVPLEWWTGEEFLISTRTHADELFPNFKPAGRSNLRKIVFLKKTGEHEKIDVNDATATDVAEKIRTCQDLNESLYRNVLEPAERPAIEQRERDVFERLVRCVPYVQFVNTRLLDFRQLNDFKASLIV